MVFYAMCCWHYDVTSVFLNVRRREEQKPLEWWVQQEWNPLAKRPLHTWLDHERSEEDKCRMSAMGNLVVPRQASLGACVLSRLLAL